MELLKECCGTRDPSGKLKRRQDILPLIKMHLPCVQICGFLLFFFLYVGHYVGAPSMVLKVPAT